MKQNARGVFMKFIKVFSCTYIDYDLEFDLPNVITVVLLHAVQGCTLKMITVKGLRPLKCEFTIRCSKYHNWQR